MDYLAGNIPGVVRCQIHICRRQFEGLRGTPHGDFKAEGFHRFGRIAGRYQWCPCRAGGYCIYSYPLFYKG